MVPISLALSKGRIFEETQPLLARVGIRPREDLERSRRLVISTSRRELRLIVVRASDTARVQWVDTEGVTAREAIRIR